MSNLYCKIRQKKEAEKNAKTSAAAKVRIAAAAKRDKLLAEEELVARLGQALAFSEELWSLGTTRVKQAYL